MKAFEKNIRKVEPYVPGEQPQRKVIKLNTNENPYAPAPGVTKALEEMNTDRLRLYPDPTAAPLVNALADFYHVNPETLSGPDSRRPGTQHCCVLRAEGRAGIYRRWI